MKMYEVGGCIRDEILGVRSKDIDFSVVLDESDDKNSFITNGPLLRHDPFGVMVHNLKAMGFEIFLETPEHLTVRAQFPKELTEANFNVPASVFQMRNNLTADFVLARKESTYSDGRRPDHVEPGTLEDDLARRDFTMNAIAKAADGTLIDPFNGQADIAAKIIRAVGDPIERLQEDALRAVRALRFSVTKGFVIDRSVMFAMQYGTVLHSLRTQIADERISDELSKMFRFDTPGSIKAMQDFPLLTEALFSGNVSLDSTLKTKGRTGKTQPDNKKKNLPVAKNGCTCLCHTHGGRHISKCC